MSEPTYDIFSGIPDKNAVWLEAVQGLSNARARMHEIAAIKPDQYFIFCSRSHSVVAQTETFQKRQSSAAKA